MSGYSKREIVEAGLNEKRIYALEHGDEVTFYRLCNELGVAPESEDLYSRGQIIAEKISLKEAPEGGLEKEVKKSIGRQKRQKQKEPKEEKPLTLNDIQFLRNYESGRFSPGYLLRLHFEKFGPGGKQDLNNYQPLQVKTIAGKVYDAYKKKEDKDKPQ